MRYSLNPLKFNENIPPLFGFKLNRAKADIDWGVYLYVRQGKPGAKRHQRRYIFIRPSAAVKSARQRWLSGINSRW